MKKVLILILIILPFIVFAGKVTVNNQSFYWDYSIQPEAYTLARLEKVITTNTLQVTFRGNSHIMYLKGVLDLLISSSPDINQDYSQEGKAFLEKLCTSGENLYISLSSEQIDANGVVHGYLWYYENDTWILHNLAAIANGYAIADKISVYRNDYQDLFEEAEQNAKDNIRGIWKSVFEKSGNVIISTSSGPIRINDVKFTGEDKYIEIINTNSSRVDLNGWKIVSSVDGRVYQFGEYILKGRKKVRIYTEPHRDDLVWEGLKLYYYVSNKIYLINNKNVRTSVYGW